MASGKSLLGAVVGRLFFREARTTAVDDLAPGFRRVTFEGEALTTASWEPGDKIQIYLPDQGTRTYTPIRWDASRGSSELLVYVHGASPGAEWGRTLRVGDRWRFFGPRRSIRASELAGSAVVFGDETSFGVGRALSDALGGTSAVRCVFEVGNVTASSAALAQLGLPDATLVERRAEDAHLAEAREALVARLGAQAGASLVMTGRAQSIQILRAQLKQRGALRPGKVKAYWSVGKKGLD